MKSLLKTLAIILGLFFGGAIIAIAAGLTTNAGGTGVVNIATGAIPFGGPLPSVRIATSTGFVWDDVNKVLTVTNLTLGTTTAGCLQSSAGGVVWSTGTACSSGGGSSFAYPFPNNATTTGLMLLASSTIGNGTRAGGLTINGGATTTGNAYFGGNVGIGTSTPYATLSVHANSNQTNTTLFAIASSTATATTTLFAVTNAGNVGIGTTNPLNELDFGASVPNVAKILTLFQSGTIMMGFGMSGITAGMRIFGPISTADEITFGSYDGTTYIEQMRINNLGNVGIGTTSPKSKLTVNGDIGTDGLPPVVSGCGTSPTTTVGDTDTAGMVTEGTVATGCTITFNVAKTNIPFCTVIDQSGLVFSYTVSGTAIVVTNIGALSGTVLNYQCIQNNL